MLIRELKRFVVLVVPLFTVFYLTVRLIRKHSQPEEYAPEWRHQPPAAPKYDPQLDEGPLPPPPPRVPPPPPPPSVDQQHDLSKLYPGTEQPGAGAAAAAGDHPDPFEGGSEAVPPTHLEVASAGLGGASGRYFTVQFADRGSINPNIIPHPALPDTFVMVAQEHPGDKLGHVAELICNAAFRRGVLGCVSFPITLDIEPTRTTENGCNDPANPRYAPLALNVGPHDARVFYGPRGIPFVVYGSNSQYRCFGQWVQDLRVPARWDSDPHAVNAVPGALKLATTGPSPTATGDAAAAAAEAAVALPTIVPEVFYNGTEMRRPNISEQSLVEKNWFLFWDRQGAMYAHYDLYPRRSFALLGPEGSALGPDLGPDTAERDSRCLARYMPWLPDMVAPADAQSDSTFSSGAQPASIHQSTNSLAVTLCHRSDPTCQALPENTFVLTVVHLKTFRRFKSTYEPYAVLMRQTAPFSVHAVSTKPVWIRGRRSSPSSRQSSSFPAGTEVLDEKQQDQNRVTEMFYVTSISWAAPDRRYHGFLDDTLFLGFGIEDKRSAGIDVVAGDLLKGLGLCEDVH